MNRHLGRAGNRVAVDFPEPGEFHNADPEVYLARSLFGPSFIWPELYLACSLFSLQFI